MSAGTIATAALWIGGTAALVLVVHALVRAVLPPRRSPPDADGHAYPASVRDAANAVALRVAALYGVLLALVYAQQLEDYQAARRGVVREAAAVADVLADAARYGGPAPAAIGAPVRRYVRIVVEREWGTRTEAPAHWRPAWAAHEAAYGAALDLVPRTPREEALRGHLLQRLGELADVRHARQELAARDFGAVFWVPAVAGLVLVTSTFFVYAPTREVRALLVGFGAFAGLILFLIRAFDSPFEAPLRLPPAPLRRLLAPAPGAPRTIEPRTIEPPVDAAPLPREPR